MTDRITEATQLGAWEYYRANYSFRIEEIRAELSIAESGDAETRHAYQRISPLRMTDRFAVKERVVGIAPGVSAATLQLDPATVPSGLNVDVSSATTVDGWRAHRLRFRPHWQPDQPLSFTLSAPLRGAYSADPVGAARRSTATVIRGAYQFHVRHSLARLVLVVKMYRPYEWLAPDAWPGSGPRDDDETNILDAVCADFEVSGTPSERILTVHRPLPGHSFAVPWVPQLTAPCQ